MPYYYGYLGAEAYGLVGFYVLLNSWLTLLTSAFAPALAREVAYRRGAGLLFNESFLRLLRSVELLVLVIAAVTTVAVCIGSSWLAQKWLQLDELNVREVAYAICLMGAVIGLRWGVMLYHSVLNGLEDQVWLGGSNVVFTTVRFGGGYALLRWISTDPSRFFEFQALASMLELLVLARHTYSKGRSDAVCEGAGLCLDFKALRYLAPFAGGVAYTSVLWVLTTQTDKLILSHTLALEKYGRYAMLIVLANGVLLMATPVTQAVLPRMTRLHAAGERDKMLRLYAAATGLLTILAGSAAGVLALFYREVLFVFTGSGEGNNWDRAVLVGYGVGNGILALTMMQYLLQQVHGTLRMHVINSTVSTVVQVPVMIYLAFNMGPAEVAFGWLILRLLAFFLWPAIVHRNFAPGLHQYWLLRDIIRPLLGVLAGLAVASFLMHVWPGPYGSRLNVAIGLAFSGVVCAALAVALGGLGQCGIVEFVREGEQGDG